jgi:hypothetical protein
MFSYHSGILPFLLSLSSPVFPFASPPLPLIPSTTPHHNSTLQTTTLLATGPVTNNHASFFPSFSRGSMATSTAALADRNAKPSSRNSIVVLYFCAPFAPFPSFFPLPAPSPFPSSPSSSSSLGRAACTNQTIAGSLPSESGNAAARHSLTRT